MTRPRLLDLFCGAGGAAMGYHRAGFEVVGVDVKPQPRYPFEFYRADALEYPLEGFNVIHASPPCQKFARGTPDRSKHQDLIGETRKRLLETGKPWILENVPGAPIRADIIICGCQVGLPMIRRVRYFETYPRLFILMPTCWHNSSVITVTGTGCPSGTIKSFGRIVKTREMQAAMGIDWMSRKELSEAIPPAYTEFIGKQIIKAIKETM